MRKPIDIHRSIKITRWSFGMQQTMRQHRFDLLSNMSIVILPRLHDTSSNVTRSNIYGHCSSRSVWASSQSDLIASISADKSIRCYFIEINNTLLLSDKTARMRRLIWSYTLCATRTLFLLNEYTVSVNCSISCTRTLWTTVFCLFMNVSRCEVYCC